VDARIQHAAPCSLTATASSVPTASETTPPAHINGLHSLVLYPTKTVNTETPSSWPRTHRPRQGVPCLGGGRSRRRFPYSFRGGGRQGDLHRRPLADAPVASAAAAITASTADATPPRRPRPLPRRPSPPQPREPTHHGARRRRNCGRHCYFYRRSLATAPVDAAAAAITATAADATALSRLQPPPRRPSLSQPPEPKRDGACSRRCGGLHRHLYARSAATATSIGAPSPPRPLPPPRRPPPRPPPEQSHPGSRSHRCGGRHRHLHWRERPAAPVAASTPTVITTAAAGTVSIIAAGANPLRRPPQPPRRPWPPPRFHRGRAVRRCCQCRSHRGRHLCRFGAARDFAPAQKRPPSCSSHPRCRSSHSRHRRRRPSAAPALYWPRFRAGVWGQGQRNRHHPVAVAAAAAPVESQRRDGGRRRIGWMAVALWSTERFQAATAVTVMPL